MTKLTGWWSLWYLIGLNGVLSVLLSVVMLPFNVLFSVQYFNCPCTRGCPPRTGSSRGPETAGQFCKKERDEREGEGGGGLLGSPADTELVDCLCLVGAPPGLPAGLQCWQAREEDSPRVYLELTVVTPGPEHQVSEGLPSLCITACLLWPPSPGRGRARRCWRCRPRPGRGEPGWLWSSPGGGSGQLETSRPSWPGSL